MNQSYSPRGFSFLPPVVKNLLIINGLGFLAYLAFGTTFNIDLNKILGVYYPASENFRVYQFVTYMFMHGNFSHLLFNMFAFWMFGYLLENVWGSKRFLIYYFVTGFGAIIIHMIVNFIQFFPIPNAIEIYANSPSPDDFLFVLDKYFAGGYNKVAVSEFVKEYAASPNNSHLIAQSKVILTELYKSRINIPTVGASGAVFGILLAFGMMFPNQRIYIYFLFPIKAKWFVMIYGAFELISGFTRPDSNIAHFAHLGGMIFGYFLIKHWNRNKFNFNNY